MQNWLGELPDKTGVLVYTDGLSLLVQEAWIAAGRSIPHEIALIGVGNDEAVCELATTPLSSVKLNTERAGYNALNYIAQRLRAAVVAVAPLKKI